MIDKTFNRILFVTLLLFVVSIPMTPLITQADTMSAGLAPPCGGTNPDGSNQNQCGFKDLLVVLSNVIEFAIKTLAPIFVAIMIVTGGFYLLTAGPSPGRAARGKELIKWALIGYAIIMLSYIIVNTVLQMIGVVSWTGLSTWWDIQL